MPLPIEKLIDGRLSELDLRWPELIARLGYKNISRGLPSLGLSGPRQEIFPLVIMRRVYSLAVSPSSTRPWHTSGAGRTMGPARFSHYSTGYTGAK